MAGSSDNSQKTLISYFKTKLPPLDVENKGNSCQEANTEADEILPVEFPKRRKLNDSASTKHEKFLTKWYSEFPWVTFNEDLNRMFCKVCRDGNMKVGMAINGSSCFQKSTLTRHERTVEHKFAMKKPKDAQIMKNVLQNINSNVSDGDLAVFKTIYMLSKEELAQTKYKPIMMLLKYCGNEAVKDQHINLSHVSISPIQKIMSDVLESELDAKIHQSQFISLLVDESTDISVDHKLIIYVRYIFNNEPHSSLWANLKLSGECTAEVLKITLIDFLQKKNVPLSKLVCLVTDGAAVMMGPINGLGKKLQHLVPSLLHYHCIAHRLALAVSQAAEGIRLFLNCQKLLGSLYVYFHTSCIRSEKFKHMQEILHQKTISLKEIHAVRWLSLGRAVAACHDSYDALILTLSHILEEKNSKTPADKGPSLLKHCSEYAFVATLSFLRDVLQIIDNVSRMFQSNDVDFSTLINILYSTIDRLKLMKDDESSSGEHLSKFLKETKVNGYYKDIKLSTHTNSAKEFQTAKVKFLDQLIANLEYRFNLENMHLLNDFDQLLNPSCTQATNSTRLASLEKLIKHYSCDTYFGVSEENLKEEYFQMQSLYCRNSEMKLPQFCNMIITSAVDSMPVYPGFTSLSKLALAIPLSTAVCERGFSTQNRIKSQKRNRLTEESVDILTRLSELGPNFCEKDGDVDCQFNFDKAIQIWKSQKQRRLNF